MQTAPFSSNFDAASKMPIFAIEKLENIASFVKNICKRPTFRLILTVRKIF